MLVGLGLEFKPSKKLRATRIAGALLCALLLTSRPPVSAETDPLAAPAWAEAAAGRRARRHRPWRCSKPCTAPARATTSRRGGTVSAAPTVDSLTQLPTRVYFEDRLAAAATKADANSSRLALLFIDLDGFKPVNDTYGHSIGDLVLEQVGQRLKAMSRGKDVVARVGGDEFLLLLSNVHDAGGDRPRRRPPDPGPVAALRGRGSRGDDLVLGRHRDVPRRLQPRQADRPRRRGDVRIEALGRLEALLLFERDGRRRGGAVRAAARPAQGRRRQGVRALLPAEDRRQERQGHRRRGAAALEASDARPAAAEHLHPDRRALRPDRRDRQLGDRGRLPAEPPVAREGRAHARRHQPLGAPDAPGRHRRAHHRRAAGAQDPSRRC